MRCYGPDIPESTAEFLKSALAEKGHKKGYRTAPVRSTAINRLAECERKFLWSERLGLQPRTYNSALSRGAWYHEYTRCFRLGLDPGPVSEEKWVKAEKELIEDAGPDMLLPGGVDVASVLREMKEDQDVAFAMATAMWKRFPCPGPDSHFVIARDPQYRPIVENIYEVGLSSHIQGIQPIKFDCVICPAGNQKVLWIVDEKTTSLEPAVRASSLSFSTQTFLYALALEYLTFQWGWQCGIAGFVHNVVKVPTIRQKQHELFADYVKRVEDWYAEDPDPGKSRMLQSWTRFSHTPTGAVEYPPDFFENLKAQKAASSRLPRFAKFPRREAACFNFNRTCPYLPLCAADPATWPGTIGQRFKFKFREDTETGIPLPILPPENVDHV